jgi:hypothetical protein
VADTNLVEVTFVGATFKAATAYNICNAGTQIATATPGLVAGPINFGVSIAAPLPAGTVLNFTDSACAVADQPVNVTLNSTASATTATIKFRLLTSAAILLDDSSAAPLAAIARKYTAVVANSNHVIDVAVAAGADGTQFTAATGTNAAGALGGVPTVQADSGQGTGLAASSFALTVTAKNVDEITNTNGNAVPGLTTSANIILSDTDFSGISLFRIVTAGLVCSAGNALVTSGASPAIPTTLLLPSQAAGGVDQTTPGGTKNYTLCTLVNDTTFLNPRTLLGSVDFNTVTLAAGANDDPATTAAAVQTWTINGADFRLTGVKGGTGDNTTISINNLGSTTGTIRRMEVYNLVGTTGLLTPSCVVSNILSSTFAIPPFSGNTINANPAGLITAQCAGPAPFITDPSAQAYGLRLVLDIAPGSVGVQATRVFSDGRLLSIPVLKGGPGAVFANE